MARRRLAVAVLVTGPVGQEIDGIRRALGDRQLTRILPHVTIVPPVNVAAEAVEAAAAIVRHVAGASNGPVESRLGPVTTFGPTSPTLFLAVSPVDELDELRRACLTGPLLRPSRNTFIPHVTVDIERADGTERDAAVSLLSSYRQSYPMTRLTLLEHHRLDTGHVWEPLTDAVLGGRTEVDAGSLRIELTESSLIEPWTAETLGIDADVALGSGRGDGIVVTARAADDHGTGAVVVGLAAGRERGPTAAALAAVTVHPEARGQGVGRRLLRAWEVAAGNRQRLVAANWDDDGRRFLEALGWKRTEPLLEHRP